MTAQCEPGRLSERQLDTLMVMHVMELDPDYVLAVIERQLASVERHMQRGLTFEAAWSAARTEARG